MASVIESLKEARELYEKMARAARQLEKAATAAEQNYERLDVVFNSAVTAGEHLRISAEGCQQELRRALSRFVWLCLFAGGMGGMVVFIAFHLFSH